MNEVTVLEKVPKAIRYRLGNHIDYKAPKRTILLEKVEKMKSFFYNKENDSYWPFEWKQAIQFLDLLDYETSL